MPPEPLSLTVDDLYRLIGRQQAEIDALRRLVAELRADRAHEQPHPDERGGDAHGVS